MPLTPDRSQHASAPTSALAMLERNRDRLERYLSPALADALDEARQGALPQALLLEAFVHLAAARYTIATYLPRLLVRKLLRERLSAPWLHWTEGSLLFADLSGSTALAERLSAQGREGTEIVADFLNHLFEQMIGVIQSHGGDLISFGGDALLVSFGGLQHTQVAVRAALALQDTLRGYVKTLPGIGSFPMHLHIGVESGRMAFLSAGRPGSLHYSVLGEVVNAVARAESVAGPEEVVVGPMARARLGSRLSGPEAAPGYTLVTALGGQGEPRPAEEGIDAVIGTPEQAIPHLLDELDSLSAYLPGVLLSRLLIDPQRPQIEAELRPVSVIFAQVLGLEALADRLAPERAARVVQAYVEPMQAIVERFGGVVNKLDVAEEGARLVAMIGAPTAYEDHAERAARAALAMQAEIEAVNRRIAGLLGEHERPAFAGLRQRIGLNLGTTFAGNVGSPIRKEYTVMGDAVNVAARVMQQAPWSDVWCSDATAQAIAARMQCAERGSVALKGKSAPMRVFQLVGAQELTAPAPSDVALVGRQDEIAWLGDRLSGALAGQGCALRIVGEAGVGKSRLAAALAEQAQAGGARVIQAACMSYSASIPYAAWSEWLKALCGISSGHDEGARAAMLSERLADLTPPAQEWLPLLADLVRVDVPENRLTRGLDPQLRQARRFELIEQLLLRAAERQPLLVVFEDLHWADPISLELWRRIARRIAGRPVLLAGVHRALADLSPESDGAQVLQVQELSAGHSAQLVGALLNDVALPDALRDALVARSAGNPLFLAELLRAVRSRMDGDAVQLDEPRISAAGEAPVAHILSDLPDSLNGLLLSRIVRLDEVSRSVLRVASVIGQRIPFGVLQSIQPFDQRALIRQLMRLDTEQLTYLERVEPERVHAFRHALIQEVAYQSMLYARRRELHGRIGEYLERRYGAELDEYCGLLAHHYRLSDRPDKAIDYLVRAGHIARDNYANAEAIQHYRWALDLLGPDSTSTQRWEAQDALGDVYEAIGRYDEALAEHSAIIAAGGVEWDIARRAHRKRGGIREKQGRYAEALEGLDLAMRMALSSEHPVSPLALPRTYADIALVRQRLGEYDLAIGACEQGLAALRQTDRIRIDELIEADLHSILGGIYGMRGDYQRSHHHFERCLAAREAADDLPGVSSSHSNLGYLWQLQSAYERALEHYRVAEEHARTLHLPYIQIIVNTNAADALISLGRYAEAQQRCHTALAIAQEMNARHTTAQIYNTLGIIFSQLGRYDDALAAYDQAQQLNRELGSVFEEANVLFNTAQTLTMLGRYDEAADASEQVRERAAELQSQRLLTEALIALAEARFGQNQLASAIEAAQQARRLADELGSRHDGAIALRLLGMIAARQSQPFAPYFEESIAMLSTIQHRYELARTWAEYGIALDQAGNRNEGQTYLKQAQDAFFSIGAHAEHQRVAPLLERSV
jgi:class 3 adenylate cyclase/tetratricopeptide (TPR) repeat protein